MKQNRSFLLQEIAGVPYLLPFGQMIADHKRGLKTNATGVYLWNLLETEHTLEEVLSLSAAYYEIPAEELPEFKKEITQFIKQLLHYDILTEAAPSTDWPASALTKLAASRNRANSKKTAADHFTTDSFCSQSPSTPCEYLLSIAGLLIRLTIPKAAYPLDFSNFEAAVSEGKNIPAHLNLTLHDTLPSQQPNGQVLLHNFELNIIEQEDQYLLHFPTAKQHLEIHLTKDGSEAHCYSLPPYNNEFHYDFFHAIRLLFLYQAQQHNMLALHSASLLYRGKIWLFSGHSGMGKSTHTNLWKELFNTPIINGDLNLLAIENGQAVVHGIPWCGTSGIYDTKTYPIGGIILLHQATENYTEELSADQKQLLVSQRLISPAWTKEQWCKNIELVEQITANILVCKLHCTKEEEAAEVMKNRIENYLG